MSHSETRTARLLREMRVSFVLALPLVLGQASSMAMNIVDTLLAGRHGPVTLAAVGVGSAIWSVVILVSIGVLMAVRVVTLVVRFRSDRWTVLGASA